MENHSETINNENKEIKKKVFDKVFDKIFDKVFDKVFIELERTEEDLFFSALRLFKYEKDELARKYNLRLRNGKSIWI